MPFEETTSSKTKNLRADVMASIGGAKPETLSLTLSFSEKCAAELGISENEAIKVLVGTGKDEGLIRLVPDPNGLCRALRFKRNGIAVIRCGHHPSFTKPREKSACNEFARIEKGKIEIKLPAAWPEKPFRNGGGAPLHKRGLVNISAAKQASSAASALQPQSHPTGQITEHGVTISFTRNAEKVIYGKKAIDVTARQALAIAALAKNFGKSVGRSWLMNELWPGQPVAAVHRDFDILIRDLSEAVQKLGLMLIKGDGYTLTAARNKNAGARA